jgi:AcrR family transcriptional regulator
MLDVAGTAHPRRRRADAERSIASIVSAAVEIFSRRPDASMTEIAAAAGVGRVTLYAHFPSREVLLEAAVEQAVAHASAALHAADIDDGSAVRALGRLVRSGWSSIERYQGLLAAGGELSPARLRARHAGVLTRIERLIARGQAAGEFRTDVPREWLVTVCYSLFHAAAQEVREGRLDAATATEVLEATLVVALTSRPGPADPR